MNLYVYAIPLLLGTGTSLLSAGLKYQYTTISANFNSRYSLLMGTNTNLLSAGLKYQYTTVSANFNSPYYLLMGTSTSLLSAGLKYHDITVSANSSREGNISLTALPAAICENIAPVMAKKKPA
ncbi:hypothetical protein SAMN04488121_102349 [Chitinophaga filiformis]|uniref:Uncharacterized protein n=1 Tax=Chitinophaga filiformis TaxID=104663 RepID=A0A1G7MAI5_CHIFI|nr:hypothetical protein SAMN04488121_102349 [Chitinophaga filiformis]